MRNIIGVLLIRVSIKVIGLAMNLITDEIVRIQIMEGFLNAWQGTLPTADDIARATYMDISKFS